MATLGIKFPDTDSLPIEHVLECAKVADEAGFDSLWMSDYKSGDVFSVLSACALVTERIKLGSGVVVVFNRAPTTVAMCAASVDIISKGRFILGLGQGHRHIVEEENGLQYAKPFQRLVEYTEIIRALIKDGRVSYRGQIFKLDYYFWFKPYRERIPIYFGPMFPQSMELTGRMADGAVSTQLTVQRTPFLVQGIREGAIKAGRDPAEVDVGSYLLTLLTKDKKAARDVVKRHMAWYVGTLARYRNLMRDSGFLEVDKAAEAWQAGDEERAANLLSDELADAVAIIGDVDECQSRIEEYRRAGLMHPIIYPIPLREDETKKAFMDAVKLRG